MNNKPYCAWAVYKLSITASQKIIRTCQYFWQSFWAPHLFSRGPQIQEDTTLPETYLEFEGQMTGTGAMGKGMPNMNMPTAMGKGGMPNIPMNPHMMGMGAMGKGMPNMNMPAAMGKGGMPNIPMNPHMMGMGAMGKGMPNMNMPSAMGKGGMPMPIPMMPPGGFRGLALWLLWWSYDNFLGVW